MSAAKQQSCDLDGGEVVVVEVSNDQEAGSDSSASQTLNGRKSSTSRRSSSVHSKLKSSRFGESLHSHDHDDVDVVDDERKKKEILIARDLTFFLSIASCLVASLTIHKLKNLTVWGVEFWKWCLVVTVVSSGMLVPYLVHFKRSLHFIVNLFLRKPDILLEKKVASFANGLMKSVQILVGSILLLSTWLLIIKPGLQQSKVPSSKITRGIVALVIGAVLWLLKTWLAIILASKFQTVTFTKRVDESILHQRFLQTLSGSLPPGKLQQTEQEKVSWTMKVDAVTSGLAIISDKAIATRKEAADAADDLFNKVAPGAEYIEEAHLLEFMTPGDVKLVLSLLEPTMTIKVSKETLRHRVGQVYNSRITLARALSENKQVTGEVNNMLNGLVLIIIIAESLLVLKIATTDLLVFLSSQLVLAAFAFGNTCKNVFESIIFLFGAHPYDVGDCIVFEGVTMIVEEMNIANTVFLKLSNKEKVYYPNSVLSAKSISNHSRSSDLTEAVEFTIALPPAEKIDKLKEKIKQYIEGNGLYWHEDHNVVVIDIENVDKLKMAIHCQYKMKFQDYVEKNLHRAELKFQLLKMLEELNINLVSSIHTKSESQ